MARGSTCSHDVPRTLIIITNIHHPTGGGDREAGAGAVAAHHAHHPHPERPRVCERVEPPGADAFFRWTDGLWMDGWMDSWIVWLGTYSHTYTHVYTRRSYKRVGWMDGWMGLGTCTLTYTRPPTARLTHPSPRSLHFTQGGDPCDDHLPVRAAVLRGQDGVAGPRRVGHQPPPPHAAGTFTVVGSGGWGDGLGGWMDGLFDMRDMGV